MLFTPKAFPGSEKSTVDLYFIIMMDIPHPSSGQQQDLSDPHNHHHIIHPYSSIFFSSVTIFQFILTPWRHHLTVSAFNITEIIIYINRYWLEMSIFSKENCCFGGNLLKFLRKPDLRDEVVDSVVDSVVETELGQQVFLIVQKTYLIYCVSMHFSSFTFSC